jgi:peptidoglycan/LPS O-acetylase OafA/YrhL
VDRSENPARFAFIDALRGIAALWVVLYHLFEAKHVANLEIVLPHWTVQLMHMGYLGLAIFFVLSGFVIAHSIGGARVDASYIGRFMLRRSVRLAPPYWASILAIILVAAQAELPSVPSLLAHMFYLQDLLRFEPISPIYWTLCLEIQLYLVFVSLLAIAHRFRSSGTDPRSLYIVFAAAAVVAALFPLAIVYEETLPAGLFLRKWYAFLVGVFAYWAVTGTIRRTTFYAYAGAVFVGAIYVNNADAIVSMGIGALLLEAGRAGKLCDWLNTRPLQLLGRISYSLYLTHPPITAVTLAFTLYRLTPRTPLWELIWLVVVVAVSCIGAWLFWRFIEKPSMVLARHCRPSPFRVCQPVLAEG